jgi:hypothetical protein
MQSHISVFGLMFPSQPGSTALLPFAPSQERDWTSAFIQPTHIPQDQGSTGVAATSSGFSKLHIPLDQRSTAGAATSSGLSKLHIPQDQGSTGVASTSSGLSQGRASWMWWQSDQQREEFVNAVTVETAEVKLET